MLLGIDLLRKLAIGLVGLISLPTLAQQLEDLLLWNLHEAPSGGSFDPTPVTGRDPGVPNRTRRQRPTER